MAFLFKYGLIGLFFASFLAATIVPVGSEPLLTLLIFSGVDVFDCLLVATAGNWLGGMSTFALGYFGKIQWVEKILRVKHEKLEKAVGWVEKNGTVLAFFCWLPFIGDLIALALGFVRASVYRVAFLMLAGKAFRYAVWSFFTLAGQKHLLN